MVECSWGKATLCAGGFNSRLGGGGWVGRMDGCRGEKNEERSGEVRRSLKTDQGTGKNRTCSQERVIR